ncbi:hypothetical protein ACFX2C_030973 [Malus domestica]
MDKAEGAGKSIVKEFYDIIVHGSTVEIHMYWARKEMTAILYLYILLVSHQYPTMDDFRSKLCGHGRTEVETNDGGSGTSSGVNGMQDLRCYNTSYTSSVHPQ